MTSWAIVAVPDQQDPVWKISSEKIPHMTLLYFGEQSDPALAARISEFVQHAVNFGTLKSFGLSVSKRGTLGEDKADVLFFEDDQIRQVEKFRQYLLGNRDIKAAYDSTQQYPSWTPHLTLGYPDSPAKEVSPGYDHIGYVRFDRIMVWVDDFDGPSFDLPSEDSLLTQSDKLQHYGIKGMKWGVIRERDSKTGRVGKSTRAEKLERRKVKLEDKGKYKKALATEEQRLTEKYKALPPPNLSKKQKIKAGAENQKKFLAKAGLEPDDSFETEEKSGFKLTKKHVAWGLVGVATVAYVGYAIHSGKKAPPGEPISASAFGDQVSNSKFRSWYTNDYLKPSSFDQQEFTLPVGHVFHRISTLPEQDFKQATYATSSVEDFNRYVAAFRKEKGSKTLNHVTFTAQSEIKIPSLLTRLEATREVLKESGNLNASERDAKAKYTSLSGGSWNDDFAQKLIGKLKNMGYDGIIDDMDAGVIGESPLVLFSPEKMGAKSATALTDDMIAKAESSLIEIMNRK